MLFPASRGCRDRDTRQRAPRFIQRVVGYKAMLVNGEVSLIDGEHTGVRAGQSAIGTLTRSRRPEQPVRPQYSSAA